MLALRIMSLFMALLVAAIGAEPVIIRYATIAPKGTVYTNDIYRFKSEIHKRTNGQVDIVVFDGGVAGTEQEIIRKLEAGKIDMAGLTGIGLGYIDQKVRILDIPFFFQTNEEVDRCMEKLYPLFKADFQAKGYMLAGWGETGWVYLLSKKPVSSYKDLQGLKIFAPKGDRVVKAMFEEFGTVPVYLEIEEVLPNLKNGNVNAVFAPLIGAIGLLWHGELNHITNLKLNNFTSAYVLKKTAWERIPKEHRSLFIELSEKHARNLVLNVRKANGSALKTLERRGLKLVNVNKTDLEDLKRRSHKIEEKLAAKGLYSPSFLKTARSCRGR